MWISKPTCDICGILKKETNHWYMLWATDLEFKLTRWKDQLEPFEAEPLHLCGRQCVDAAKERWVEGKPIRIEKVA